MSIIRTKRKKNNFSIIDNTGLVDPTLTWKETGLLAFLMTKPDDWEISIKALSNNKKDGRDSVAAALKGLQQKGYVYRLDSREQGRFQTEYLVFETKEDLQEWLQDNDSHRNGFSVTAKPERQNRNGLTGTVNPSQLNTDIDITDQLNTKELNTEKRKTPPTPSPEAFNLERSGDVPDTPQIESASEKTSQHLPAPRIVNQSLTTEIVEGVLEKILDEQKNLKIAKYQSLSAQGVKLPAPELRDWANLEMGECVKCYRKSGFILSGGVADISNEFAIFVANKNCKKGDEPTIGLGLSVINKCEADPRNWQKLALWVIEWQKFLKTGNQTGIAETVSREQRLKRIQEASKRRFGQ